MINVAKLPKAGQKEVLDADALFSVMRMQRPSLTFNEVANLEASRVHNALGRLMIRANDANVAVQNH